MTKKDTNKLSVVDLHLAAMLLSRFEPMAAHHVGWVREYLGYPTDNELVEIIRTGKRIARGECS